VQWAKQRPGLSDRSLARPLRRDGNSTAAPPLTTLSDDDDGAAVEDGALSGSGCDEAGGADCN